MASSPLNQEQKDTLHSLQYDIEYNVYLIFIKMVI